MININKIFVKDNKNIRSAIKILDRGGIGLIIVINKDEKVAGIVADGDFRRAILNGISLDENITKIINRKFISIGPGYNDDEINNIFNTTIIKHLPIIDDGKLIDLITEEEYFGIKKERKYPTLDLPVVIMAGGKGARMDPITRILPKPLVPIGNKAIIEVIMDEYAKFGMKKFYISINHKGKMIRAYFEDHESNYTFQYITETKPLGTAGALKYLYGKINTPFFVSNCDILIKEDYSKIYEFHKKGSFELTSVASMKNLVVPYGVCEIKNGGELKNLNEKPQYDFLVNTGMYLLNPEVFKYIPKGKFFHMTQLIKKIQESGLKIGVYPISERMWMDVGQWEDYKNIRQNFKT